MSEGTHKTGAVSRWQFVGAGVTNNPSINK